MNGDGYVSLPVTGGRVRWAINELREAGVDIAGIQYTKDGGAVIIVNGDDAETAAPIHSRIAGYEAKGHRQQAPAGRSGWPISTFDIMVGAAVLFFGSLACLGVWTGNLAAAVFGFVMSLAAAIIGPRWSRDDKRAQLALRAAGLGGAMGNRRLEAIGFVVTAILILLVAAALWAAELGFL